MRDGERASEVDRRINAALRSYAEPGEIPETRLVLARLMERAAVSERSGFRWWSWVAGAACAAVITALVAGWTIRSSRSPQIAWVPRAPLAAATAPGGDLAIESHPAARSFVRQQRVAQQKMSEQKKVLEIRLAGGSETERLPKLEVFPTPRPLSTQEQALVAFVKHAPAGVRQAVMEDQQHWDKPIVVAEVTIRPLGADEKHNPNPER